VEQQQKWSGRVVATARFVLAVDEYVRAGVVEEAAGRSDADAKDWRGQYAVSIAVEAARDELRGEVVGRYCAIEAELPATLHDLLTLERRVVDDWGRAVHAFVIEVQSRDAGLLPAWSTALHGR
jgi:hypothetical protein